MHILPGAAHPDRDLTARVVLAEMAARRMLEMGAGMVPPSARTLPTERRRRPASPMSRTRPDRRSPGLTGDRQADAAPLTRGNISRTPRNTVPFRPSVV